MRALVLLLALAACARKEEGDVRHARMRTVPLGTEGTSDPTGDTPPTTSETTGPTTTYVPTTTGDPPWGVDVSHWQGDIDWQAAADGGFGFAYAKASEGTYFVDSSFEDMSDGAADAGMYHGAYHFAIPDDSPGDEQAEFFVDNGGGWTDDGQTIPGVLDIEWNPNWNDDCYGLSKGEMEDWVHDFADEYLALTGRAAVIYTSRTWWNLCVDSEEFTVNPLWVADWGSNTPAMPTGWTDYAFWQVDAYGSVPGVGGDCDVDVFNGPPSALRALALGN
jgi:GH25 family lysozyme M1 (1,4-beta-N-acetylmuramidase)